MLVTNFAILPLLGAPFPRAGGTRREAMALRQARANVDYIATQLNVRIGAVQAVQASGDNIAIRYVVPDAERPGLFSVRVFSSVSVRYVTRP